MIVPFLLLAIYDVCIKHECMIIIYTGYDNFFVILIHVCDVLLELYCMVWHPQVGMVLLVLYIKSSVHCIIMYTTCHV